MTDQNWSTQIRRQLVAKQWIVGCALGLLLVAGLWVSLSQTGLRLETSGVLMTLNLSPEQGLVVKFDSLTR